MYVWHLSRRSRNFLCWCAYASKWMVDSLHDTVEVTFPATMTWPWKWQKWLDPFQSFKHLSISNLCLQGWWTVNLWGQTLAERHPNILQGKLWQGGDRPADCRPGTILQLQRSLRENVDEGEYWQKTHASCDSLFSRVRRTWSSQTMGWLVFQAKNWYLKRKHSLGAFGFGSVWWVFTWLCQCAQEIDFPPEGSVVVTWIQRDLGEQVPEQTEKSH